MTTTLENPASPAGPGSPARPGPLRVGVLGCATIAGRRMLPAMRDSDLIDLVAVASRGADRAADFGRRFGCEAVVGYDPLLERSDVDAVYLPLPSGLHAAWVARALAAGKHVLVEKPFATRQADAEELVAMARARGLLLVESFMFLHHSQHAEVRRLVADGAIGELRAFSAAFGIPPLPAGDIRYQRELGGGALFDVGVYPIRAAQHFLGGDLEVLAATRYEDDALGVDLRGSALLATPDGVTAQLAYGFQHGYRSGYELWGSAGRLVLDRAFTPGPDQEPVLRLHVQGKVVELTLKADHQFRNIAESFARGVLSGVDGAGAGADILRQAALVEQVRLRALRYPR